MLPKKERAVLELNLRRGNIKIFFVRDKPPNVFSSFYKVQFFLVNFSLEDVFDYRLNPSVTVQPVAISYPRRRATICVLDLFCCHN